MSKHVQPEAGRWRQRPRARVEARSVSDAARRSIGNRRAVKSGWPHWTGRFVNRIDRRFVCATPQGWRAVSGVSSLLATIATGATSDERRATGTAAGLGILSRNRPMSAADAGGTHAMRREALEGELNQQKARGRAHFSVPSVRPSAAPFPVPSRRRQRPKQRAPRVVAYQQSMPRERGQDPQRALVAPGSSASPRTSERNTRVWEKKRGRASGWSSFLPRGELAPLPASFSRRHDRIGSPNPAPNRRNTQASSASTRAKAAAALGVLPHTYARRQSPTQHTTPRFFALGPRSHPSNGPAWRRCSI